MNSLRQTVKKPTFSMVITSDGMKKKINEIVGGERGQSFITSMISAVSNNPQLQTCDSATIISAALVGESLKLSPSAFMGQYYLVPFNDKKNNRVVAQFQIGYKGYITLAMRSGQYKDIDVFEIKEGELIGRDKETGKYLFNFIESDEERENKETIGYMAYFETLNGFKKTLYWSKVKMEKHALTYSQGYRADKQKGTNYTFWSKDFAGMAFKTMLRQLISKWGIMSIDMEKAIVNDMGVVKENGTVDYVDNNPDVIEEPLKVNETVGEVANEVKTPYNVEEPLKVNRTTGEVVNEVKFNGQEEFKLEDF